MGRSKALLSACISAIPMAGMSLTASAQTRPATCSAAERPLLNNTVGNEGRVSPLENQEISEQRPNIILILADDMGFSDLSSYGGEIPTPNIDALAKQGVSFTQFYNSARCGPSRAALMTGLNPHEAGMGTLEDTKIGDSKGICGILLPQATTIAEVLHSAGYFTAISGKWHLGEYPEAETNPKLISPAHLRGFDRSLVVPTGTYYPNQTYKGETGKITINGKPVDFGSDDVLDNGTLEKNWYGPDMLVHWGKKFIAQAESKPFFLYLSFTTAHWPLMADKSDIDRFRKKYMLGWDVLMKDRWKRQIKNSTLGRDEGVEGSLFRGTAGEGAHPKHPTSYDWTALPNGAPSQATYATQMATYAAAVWRMDRSIKDLLDSLDPAVRQNTIVLFMFDNGGNAEGGLNGVAKPGDSYVGDPQSNVRTGQNWAQLQNAPLGYFKHYVDEGGIATPLIMSWPAKMANLTSSQRVVTSPWHLIDVMPTLLDVAHATYPTARIDGTPIIPKDGESMFDSVNGTLGLRNSKLFWEHEGNKAIRDGDWKLVHQCGQVDRNGNDIWKLYNLNGDRAETNDRSNEYKLKVNTMSAAFETWRKSHYVDDWRGLGEKCDKGDVGFVNGGGGSSATSISD